MTTIDIDPKYRLGVDAIDREHAELIRIVNDLRATLDKGDGRAAEITSIVARLIDYTRTHFGHEEQLMLDSHYPGHQEHHTKHQELMVQVAKFASELAEHKDSVRLKVNLFMTIWLFEHIIKDDAAFARYWLSLRQH